MQAYVWTSRLHLCFIPCDYCGNLESNLGHRGIYVTDNMLAGSLLYCVIWHSWYFHLCFHQLFRLLLLSCILIYRLLLFWNIHICTYFVLTFFIVPALAWHPFHEEYFVSGSFDGSIFHWLVGYNTCTTSYFPGSFSCYIYLMFLSWCIWGLTTLLTIWDFIVFVVYQLPRWLCMVIDIMI